MDIDTVLAFLGKVIAAGGGGAVVAYLLFQYLGKSWIENKFTERLEQMRHDQALELQKLRVEIDSLLSGAIKIQEREFEVLPAAWDKLDEAHSLIRWFVSPAQTFADVDRMSTPQLEEYLDSTEFTETQKEEVRNSAKKGETYREIEFYYKLHRVKKVFGELQTYVAKHGIFMQPDLKEKLSTISDKLWSAIVSKEVGHEAGDWKMQNEGWKEIKDETEPLYKEIESLIQKRLQSHGGK